MRSRVPKTLDLSVVVPVYNNAATLPELIARLVNTIDAMGLRFEIVFVDDASTDSSRALLLERASADERIRVLSLTENFGGQAALCAGFETVRGRRTVCIDADLENFPEDIPALLGALDEGYELACGVRENRGDDFSTRRVPSRLLNTYARRQLKTPVKDLWCGMRAMESRVVENITAEGDRCRSLTPLLLERATSVAEVPIRHDPAKAGSQYSLLRLTAIAVDFFIGSARRPFIVIGVGAAVAGAASLALLVAALALRSGLVAMAALVVAAAATVCGVMALVGDYVQRLYTLQTRPLYRVHDEESQSEHTTSTTATRAASR